MIFLKKIPDLKSNYTKIKSIDIINMKKNQGHSRCFATGIKYLSQKINFDYLLLMDGDGEDRPEEIKYLVASTIKNQDKSFVAKRIKRSEGYIFIFFIKYTK